MPSDPCMFCEQHPCACAGRKPRIRRKALSKKEPVSKPEVKESEPKPPPKKPAPSGLRRGRTLEPEVVDLVRMLDYEGMLHRDEKVKYREALIIKKTTGKLLEEEGGETDG